MILVFKQPKPFPLPKLIKKIPKGKDYIVPEIFRLYGNEKLELVNNWKKLGSLELKVQEKHVNAEIIRMKKIFDENFGKRAFKMPSKLEKQFEK